jgi:hypothetical protein
MNIVAEMEHSEAQWAGYLAVVTWVSCENAVVGATAFLSLSEKVMVVCLQAI